MISKAGDTDTNACIVGALVGSIVGFHNLPK
jgi:ADP-ribosylglycohydrolase